MEVQHAAGLAAHDGKKVIPALVEISFRFRSDKITAKAKPLAVPVRVIRLQPINLVIACFVHEQRIMVTQIETPS